MQAISVLHHLTKSLQANFINTLVQNLLAHQKISPESLYILLDETGNADVLAAAQTLQQHFPQMIFSKISKSSDIYELARELGAAHTLTITNNNKLFSKELELAKKKLGQEINNKLLHNYKHRDLALLSEKSLWQKFLLYFRYES
jgi:hypothetical protein